MHLVEQYSDSICTKLVHYFIIYNLNFIGHENLPFFYAFNSSQIKTVNLLTVMKEEHRKLIKYILD